MGRHAALRLQRRGLCADDRGQSAFRRERDQPLTARHHGRCHGGDGVAAGRRTATPGPDDLLPRRSPVVRGEHRARRRAPGGERLPRLHDARDVVDVRRNGRAESAEGEGFGFDGRDARNAGDAGDARDGRLIGACGAWRSRRSWRARGRGFGHSIRSLGRSPELDLHYRIHRRGGVLAVSLDHRAPSIGG